MLYATSSAATSETRRSQRLQRHSVCCLHLKGRLLSVKNALFWPHGGLWCKVQGSTPLSDRCALSRFRFALCHGPTGVDRSRIVLDRDLLRAITVRHVGNGVRLTAVSPPHALAGLSSVRVEQTICIVDRWQQPAVSPTLLEDEPWQFPSTFQTVCDDSAAMPCSNSY